LVDPFRLITGLVSTIIGELGSETHPLDVWVKIKSAVPVESPVTKPVLVTDATDGLVLDQIPPVEGERVLVLPIQRLDAPVMDTTGLAVTLMLADATAEQPFKLVTVTLNNELGATG
jgi:hypothetical protein